MYKFNAKQIKDECVQWIRDWFEINGKDCNAVIGISGGVDSSVIAALCVEALGKEKVFGVLMPCGEQKDINAAKQLVNHLGISHKIINIGETVMTLMHDVSSIDENKIILGLTDQSRTNLPPRIRMATLYCVSQSISGRVIGTGNLSENYIGYMTLFGDGASDCEPIGLLTKTEVKAIGKELGLPIELIYKIPDDGLPCSLPDEENLGFTYDTLDKYIREGIEPDKKIKAKIDRMHEKNLFKLQPMPYYHPKI